MKEITIRLPDKKLNFFIELVKHLGFEVTEDVQISEEHKKIVSERIKNSKPEDLISWEEARKQLRTKSR